MPHGLCNLRSADRSMVRLIIGFPWFIRPSTGGRAATRNTGYFAESQPGGGTRAETVNFDNSSENLYRNDLQ